MGTIINALALMLIASTTPTTPDLGWLTGCWRSSDGSATEVWSESYGGWRFGHGATMSDGELVFFEQLRIETDDAGTRYVASPAGAAPTTFTATDLGTDTAAFANPDHDYPQRIRYHREGNALTAQISLMDGSRAQTFRWHQCAPDGRG